jgi:hypothetical protein
MDRDGDGRLSEWDFKGPSPAFKRMDRNNDGYITRGEAANTPLTGKKFQTRKIENEAPGIDSTSFIYVDTHNHLVGRRKMGRYNLEKQVQIALRAMDAAGVKLNLLLPMSQTVDQEHRLYFEDLLPIVKKYPTRFAALGGGGTLNVMIQQAVKEGRVTAALEEEFDARAKALVRKRGNDETLSRMPA